MKDWPEVQVLGHKDLSDVAANGVSGAAGGVGTATSTLEQLMNGTGGQAACDEDDGAPGAFMDDFMGQSEVREPASTRFCGAAARAIRQWFTRRSK